MMQKYPSMHVILCWEEDHHINRESVIVLDYPLELGPSSQSIIPNHYGKLNVKALATYGQMLEQLFAKIHPLSQGVEGVDKYQDLIGIIRENIASVRNAQQNVQYFEIQGIPCWLEIRSKKEDQT